MRKFWLDNLRWCVVLLVLLYHVIYFYNGKGVIGGIGGFGGSQPQDVIMYILYPWFMMLLFLVAGISSRYTLDNYSTKEFFRNRTVKLLVPATIGLFVFQWITGYFNTAVTSYVNGASVLPLETPVLVRYIVYSVSGIGPLWFIQDLWLFSLVLVVLRKFDIKDFIWRKCEKMSLFWIVMLGIFIQIGSYTLIVNLTNPLHGLINLYKPLSYIIPFLFGYYIFSHESVQDKVAGVAIPLSFVAIVLGVLLVTTTFGEDNTLPEYLQNPLNNLYAWITILAMLGVFRRYGDKTNKVFSYLAKSSYGIYITHYLVIASLGYMMKVYTSLQPIWMYLILLFAVFTLSPLLNEILRRIPFIRWCVFGIYK